MRGRGLTVIKLGGQPRLRAASEGLARGGRRAAPGVSSWCRAAGRSPTRCATRRHGWVSTTAPPTTWRCSPWSNTDARWRALGDGSVTWRLARRDPIARCRTKQVPVWSPTRMVLDAEDIPASWEVDVGQSCGLARRQARRARGAAGQAVDRARGRCGVRGAGGARHRRSGVPALPAGRAAPLPSCRPARSRGRGRGHRAKRTDRHRIDLHSCTAGDVSFRPWPRSRHHAGAGRSPDRDISSRNAWR